MDLRYSTFGNAKMHADFFHGQLLFVIQQDDQSLAFRKSFNIVTDTLLYFGTQALGDGGFVSRVWELGDHFLTIATGQCDI